MRTASCGGARSVCQAVPLAGVLRGPVVAVINGGSNLKLIWVAGHNKPPQPLGWFQQRFSWFHFLLCSS